MPAPEQVIEDLVVRLTGDGTEYQKMLRQIETSTVQTAQRVEEATSKIEAFTATVGGIAQTVFEVAALAGAISLLREATDNFAEAELIGLKLTATLGSNGREVDKTREEYEKFAAEMEQFTTAEDDAVLKMLTMAEAFDITGENAQKAVKDAISLSGILEGAPENYIRLTAALAKGDTEMAMRLARMVPQLRGIRNETEFLNKANQLLATGWKAAQAEADSFSGVMKKLSRDWGNMTEEFGAIVSEVVKPVVEHLRVVINWVKNTDEAFKRTITSVLGFAAAVVSIGPALAILGPITKLIAAPILAVQAGIGRILGPVLALLSPIAAIKIVVGAITGLFTGLIPILLTVINPLRIILGIVTLIKVGLLLYFGPFFSVLKWVVSIGAALGAWVRQVGGVKNAWDLVVDAADRLWKNLQPVFKAFRSLFQFIVEVGLNAILALGDKMLQWLSDLTSAMSLDWIKIRDGIVSAIYFVEMVLRNFGEIARFIFGGIKSLVAPIAVAVQKMFASADNSGAVQATTTFAEKVQALRVSITGFLEAHRGMVLLLSGMVGTIILVVAAIKLLRAAVALLHVEFFVTAAATTASAVATTGWNAITLTQLIITKALSVALSSVVFIMHLVRIQWAVAAVAAATYHTVVNSVVAVMLLAKHVQAGWILITKIFNATWAAMGAVFLVVNIAVSTWGVVGAIGKGLMLLWTGVVWLFNTALAFTKGLFIGNTAAASAFSVSELLTKAATWLLTGAITALNVAMGATIFVTAAITFGTIFAAITTVGSAAYGAVHAINQLARALGKIVMLDGPLRAVSDILKGWPALFIDVADAARVDMDRAWEVMKAGGKLLISQLEDLWPPFWKFIHAGFAALADLVSEVFQIKFKQGVNNALKDAAKRSDIFGILNKSVQEEQDAANRVAEESVKQNAILAGELGAKAAREFNRNYKISPKTEELAKELKRLQQGLEGLPGSRNFIGPIQPEMQKALNKAEEDAKKHGEKMEDHLVEPIKKATAEVSRFDAALINSAEAITRVAEYRDRLETSRINQEIDRQEALTKRRGGRQHEQVGGRFDANQRGGAEGNVRGAEQEALLRDIRNILRDQAKRPGPVLRPAGI